MTDENLGASASPRPCHQPCFISDEELTKASFAPTCNHRPCFTSDEEISATSAPGSHPGKCAPCIIETETPYISNAAHAPVPIHAHIGNDQELGPRPRGMEVSYRSSESEDLIASASPYPKPCYASFDENLTASPSGRPMPNCSCFISENDDLNVADSRRQTSSDFHVNSNEDLLLNSIASPQCMHSLYSSITSDEEYL